MKRLSLSLPCFLFLGILISAASSRATSPELRTPGLFCQGSEPFNERGRRLREFTFSSDCNEAVANLRGNMTCADEDKTVRSLLLDARNGEILKAFTFESDCLKARDEGERGFACVSNGAKTDLTNFQRGGRVVYSFIFGSDCQEALDQIPSGLACVSEMGKNILVSSNGRQLRSFTFESDCQEMREKMLDFRDIR